MQKGLTYDDVLLVPQYSDIRSRSEVSLRNRLSDSIQLDLPIIASPMDTVSETDMVAAMWREGGAAIIHRYNSIEEQIAMVSSLPKYVLVGAAVGVTNDYFERAVSLYEAGADFLCVDVAHGHHILMKAALTKLRARLPSRFHIMAGNVATLEGFNDLADWGANSIRCNIGGGSICTTRIQTGHGLPGLATIFECAKSDRDTKIIADGGIKTAGDIVKALAAGADFVMLGSLLAGTTETPGKVFVGTNGELRKPYSVRHKGSIAEVLAELERGIRSGLSYSGARTIKLLQLRAKWMQQTHASIIESSDHVRLIK
jgi:IMP dehydrogenase